ncbi:DUF167 domain-containing protein [Paracoccus zhouxuedongae]
MVKRGAWADLAVSGATFALRVTPNAARDAIARDGDGTIRIGVTATPEGGKANAAVTDLLARTLGVPKSRLSLLRGATGRDKVFRLD